VDDPTPDDLRPGLDVEAHAAEQMAKFRRRLDLLERLLG
jgi:hypothetical protein